MRGRRGWMIGLVLAALLAASCTSGDSGSDDGGDDASASTATTFPTATGPSPGVTDDTIKVGVTYVDTESLVASGLELELGDHQAVYQALFDTINDAGGINGRQLEPVFAPIDPTSPAPAEEKCVQLTEDEDVFIITGFFLADAVVCPVTTHETAVVGGEMTEERLAQATAPWVTWLPDMDQPATVLRALDEQGELDGTIGVWAAERDQQTVDDVVVPTLEDLDAAPVQTAIGVAPANDQAAQRSEMTVTAEAFEDAGVDTVVLVGSSAQGWPTIMSEVSDYRPQLLFLDVTAPRAFATNAATSDTTILEGMLAGGIVGSDVDRFDEEAMQECIATLTDAGQDTPEPGANDDMSNQPYQAAFQACPDMVLLQALLEAAGPDLNYGTLQAAIDGLEVHIPGDPTPRTFGPPPAADGNPAAHLFTWDEENQDFVPADE